MHWREITPAYGKLVHFQSEGRPKLAPPDAASQDFVIRVEDGFPGFVNLLGIESPGLTSALAIAEEVDSLLKR